MNLSTYPELGPLAQLVGTWEGGSGHDTAPSDDRGTETNPFRERITFVPTGLVQNHEQFLYGLRYSTVAWRLGEPNPFHEEVGYWLWDKDRCEVMKAFIVPRGISVLAGGSCPADGKTFVMVAQMGSPTFGIASNPFLDQEFRTERYELTVTMKDENTLHYASNTEIRMKGHAELFHHRDQNTLNRVPNASI